MPTFIIINLHKYFYTKWEVVKTSASPKRPFFFFLDFVSCISFFFIIMNFTMKMIVFKLCAKTSVSYNNGI